MVSGPRLFNARAMRESVHAADIILEIYKLYKGGQVRTHVGVKVFASFCRFVSAPEI